MIGRFCDCGEWPHALGCMALTLPAATDADLGDLVAAEDGYPACLAAIRHPSHAATRRYFAAHPLPHQTDRRTA